MRKILLAIALLVASCAGPVAFAASNGLLSQSVTPPTSGVTSFNTRTGAVTPQSGDYTFSQIGGFANAAAVPYTLAQTGIPVILQSSGSVGNNGALTLTTALPSANFTKCYMYFPAGAIASGSTAGVYYVVMSSTTLGVIYNNILSSGLPTIPATPTPFVTTGPGAYTQTINSYLNMVTVSVPAGAMGINGQIFLTGGMIINNNGDSKLAQVVFGGTVVQLMSNTTQNFVGFERIIRNMGNAAAQFGIASNISAATNDLSINGSPPFYGAINTASAQNIVFQSQLTTATDYNILGGFSIQVWPGN